jgi:hypothetical protein
MSALKALASLVLGATLLCAAPGIASAANQTYDFTGTCTDCAGEGTAELVLDGGYTPGTFLHASDLVSFTYFGTNLHPAYTVTPSTPGGAGLDGTIPASLPAAAFVVVSYAGGQFFSDTSENNGYWCVGLACIDDVGTNGIWSAAPAGVPEPGVWAILTTGVLGLGAMMRRRRALAPAG